MFYLTSQVICLTNEISNYSGQYYVYSYIWNFTSCGHSINAYLLVKPCVHTCHGGNVLRIYRTKRKTMPATFFWLK